MTLLTVALLLLATAAVGGAFLAGAHLGHSRPSVFLAVGHPVLAAAGLVALGVAYFRTGGTALVAAALTLVTSAAVLGVVLMSLRARRGSAPIPMITLHALLGLAGVTLLTIQLFLDVPRLVDPPHEPSGGGYPAEPFVPRDR